MTSTKGSAKSKEYNLLISPMRKVMGNNQLGSKREHGMRHIISRNDEKVPPTDGATIKEETWRAAGKGNHLVPGERAYPATPESD